jgi:hypothetical protein
MGKAAKVLGTIGNVATLGLLGATTGIGAPEQPKQQKPPAPPPMRELGPQEKELTSSEIAAKARDAGIAGLTAPSYLGLASGMSPLQQRTRIASQGVGGDIGTDPGAFKAYRNLAFQTLSQPGGAPTDVEKQYVGMFGEPMRTADTGGYLSAVERIYGRL